MKLNKILTAAIASAGLGLAGQAMAAGTAAGTDIQNTVTLNYSVNSTAQTAVESSSQFKVDQKVDMTLSSDTASAATAPGETVTLAYTIANTGNKSTDYVLSVANNGNADHTPQSYTFHTASPTSAANQIANNKITLAVDTPTTVYASVVMTNNANVGNGDTVEMLVTATALAPSDTDGTTLLTQNIAADKNANLSTEYVVFAEAASVNNAKQTGAITAQTNRSIVTAEFTDPADSNAVPKLNVAIINDIICDATLTAASTADYSEGGANVGTCPNVDAPNKANYRPKAIPTSMAKFSYSAVNSGAVTANAVVFSETLPAGYKATTLAQPTLSVGSVSQTLTDAGATPTATNEYFISGNTITIYVGDVDATEQVDITFTAIVE